MEEVKYCTNAIWLGLHHGIPGPWLVLVTASVVDCGLQHVIASITYCAGAEEMRWLSPRWWNLNLWEGRKGKHGLAKLARFLFLLGMLSRVKTDKRNLTLYINEMEYNCRRIPPHTTGSISCSWISSLFILACTNMDRPTANVTAERALVG